MIILWISPFLVTEQQISEKLKNIMKENAELVQKLSSYEQKVLIILLAFSPWLQTWIISSFCIIQLLWYF